MVHATQAAAECAIANEGRATCTAGGHLRLDRCKWRRPQLSAAEVIKALQVNSLVARLLGLRSGRPTLMCGFALL